ncbi:DUF896 domain-containing protein [Salinicoccus hispanicus]|uniref:UPF0291 protein GQ671_01585 n=1 Tax=Salinicoccus hispanicus TaxID=157225 RepID=A0A6N8TX45_9STAP|nr:DUF896 domain-containing protein [Salinicoccus hispanicus]MXQ49992.1 DUF896 domain-containing protein [Salinicoccus hispanicus]
MIVGLDRINELANKQKWDGLTKEERAEQMQLREDYMRQFRGQILDTFANLTVIDPEGNDVTPEKLKREQQINNLFNQ